MNHFCGICNRSLEGKTPAAACPSCDALLRKLLLSTPFDLDILVRAAKSLKELGQTVRAVGALAEANVEKLVLPEHAAGLTLEHNVHRNFYMTVDAYIDSLGEIIPTFENEDEKRRSIETEELWTLQWYSHHPMAFDLIGAPTLSGLLAFAKKIEMAGEYPDGSV